MVAKVLAACVESGPQNELRQAKRTATMQAVSRRQKTGSGPNQNDGGGRNSHGQQESELEKKSSWKT